MARGVGRHKFETKIKMQTLTSYSSRKQRGVVEKQVFLKACFPRNQREEDVKGHTVSDPTFCVGSAGHEQKSVRAKVN